MVLMAAKVMERELAFVDGSAACLLLVVRAKRKEGETFFNDDVFAI